VGCDGGGVEDGALEKTKTSNPWSAMASASRCEPERRLENSEGIGAPVMLLGVEILREKGEPRASDDASGRGEKRRLEVRTGIPGRGGY
jgi:hypothetical protein